nr:hypothetical protein [Tanacetum cinerariifolium]
PRYAIKECSSCGTLYTRYYSCSKRNVEDKILVPKPPTNCARCGHPVDRLYCQGCTFLQKKLEEGLVTHFQGFQNTSESSDDCTNVVNIPLEQFVVKQDHGSFVDKIICSLNKAPDSPHLHIFSPNQFHCFHCKDALGDGEACLQEEWKWSNAQYGHYYTPQASFINPKLGYNQDFNFPQDIHDFQQQYLCCDQCGGPHETSQCFDQSNPRSLPSFIRLLRKQVLKFSMIKKKVFKIKDAFGNEQYKLEDVQELFHKVLNDVQNIHEELAEYINTPGWNCPTFYNNCDDDDVDYTIAITLVLSTEEPDNSLSMGDEHLDTIPEIELDEVIKSSVEDLIPILSKFKGIPDTMCDVHLVNNPTPLEAKDHFEIVINSNDDYSSSDDDSLYYENIKYVEESPHDSEFVSLEVEKIVISSDFTYEEFGDEPAHIISPPEYECFYFGNFPDPGELISSLNSGIRENLSSTTCGNLPVEDDYSPLLAYVVWIFIAHLTYLVIPPHLHSFRNEDTIFDPGITINCFYSFKPGLSHRCGTFKKFNTHHSHLNKSPMNSRS